jgi:hypothetical protein
MSNNSSASNNSAGNGFLKGGKLKIIMALIGATTVIAAGLGTDNPPERLALEILAATAVFYVLGFAIEKFLTRQVFNDDNKTNEANVDANKTVDALADTDPTTLTDSE